MAAAIPEACLFDAMTPQQRDRLLREIIDRCYDERRRNTVWVYVTTYLGDVAAERLIAEAV